MEEPGEELRATAEERAKAPDFDALTDPSELVRGERTRDDFFDAVLSLATPTTVSEVAERAGHGVDAAREYLEWFEEMGIVTRVSDSPATYRRNQSYLDWRRVQTIRDEYTSEELLGFLETETDRIDEFVEEYGQPSPDAVSLSEATAGTDRSIESVWNDLSAWRTARRHVTLLERALSSERGEPAGRRATT